MDKDTLIADLEDALAEVRSERLEDDVVSAGLVRDLEVDEDGGVRFRLLLDPRDSSELPAEVRNAASLVDGVSSVRVEVRSPADGDRETVDTDTAGAGRDPEGSGTGGGDGGPAAGGPEASGRSLPVVGQGSGQEGGGAGSAPGAGAGSPGGPAPGSEPVSREEASRHPSEAEELEGVRHVVAVSSGKGGVGKSTVATNLAAAWADEGHRVGLLDADIYGPDIPTMFGVHDKPRMADDRVIPLEAHGVKLMSIGFLVDEDTPAMWRGPIIMGIVRQFLQQVEWGELDYLVVDLPPGTGDAQLSLVQLCKVTGAVMVTTPQDVAVGGVLKGIRMFEKLDVPVAGVVENMRGFVCPDCGESHEIFGSGGGEKLAASLAMEFLGAVPLGVAVREEGDRGVPTVLGRPESPEGAALREIAASTSARLEEMKAGDEESDDGGAEAGEGGEERPSGAAAEAG